MWSFYDVSWAFTSVLALLSAYAFARMPVVTISTSSSYCCTQVPGQIMEILHVPRCLLDQWEQLIRNSLF